MELEQPEHDKQDRGQNAEETGVGTQTELTLETIKSMEERYCQPAVKVVGNKLSEELLKSDKDAVKFYTGLPSYSRLKVVFEFVSAPFETHPNCVLPLFEQFLMVLMKLRLNLCDQDLAYRFGVSQPTVSRNFRKWVDMMHTRLKPTIQWPSREAVVETMPSEFRREF